MANELNLRAVKVQQGDLTLYSTAIKVKDLIRDGFYSVETLDPSNASDSGYQRILNQARAKKLADYILKGLDRQDAFLPTSVFLATSKAVSLSEDGSILLNTSETGPFNVVDGQHRLEGLKMAAMKDDRALEFQVPVNIAVGLPKLHQMCHFLIVNTTQKSVDESVAQQITARLTDAVNVEDMPSLPKWIQTIVEKGEVNRAVKLVAFLNSESNSPWYGKINMANDDRSRNHTINQRSFVKSVVRYVLTANNPIESMGEFEKQKKIFLNYWRAISDLVDEKRENTLVLYKYNGVDLFCRFSVPFFHKLYGGRNFTVDAMKALLSECFENLEGEYAGVGHAQWWARGGKAGGLNAGAIGHVVQEMAKTLNKPSMGVDIEL